MRAGKEREKIKNKMRKATGEIVDGRYENAKQSTFRAQ